MQTKGGRGIFWGAVLTLSVAAGPACDQDLSTSGATGTLVTKVDTVAGRVVVRNQGTPPAWALEPVLRLGRGTTTGEAAPDEFGRVTGVLGGEDGAVYVADELTSEIRVFDEEGRLVRAIGGEGGGPGEFRRLLSIGWIGDTIATLDAGNARLGLLTSGGVWLGQRAYLSMAGENIRLYQTGPHEVYMPFLRTGGGESSLVFVRQTANGPADTLPWSQDVYSHRNRVLCRHSAGQGISFYVSKLAPIVIQVPAPEILTVRVWTADYRIAFLDPGGDPVRVVQRDILAAPLTESEWQAERAKFDDFRDTFDDERCEPASLPRPEAKGLIRAIFFDDRQRMWVERRTGSGFAFDVFESDGWLVASLAAPERDERVPPYVSSNMLYLAQRDSLGVQYVRGFKILRS